MTKMAEGQRLEISVRDERGSNLLEVRWKSLRFNFRLVDERLKGLLFRLGVDAVLVPSECAYLPSDAQEMAVCRMSVFQIGRDLETYLESRRRHRTELTLFATKATAGQFDHVFRKWQAESGVRPAVRFPSR